MFPCTVQAHKVLLKYVIFGFFDRLTTRSVDKQFRCKSQPRPICLDLPSLRPDSRSSSCSHPIHRRWRHNLGLPVVHVVIHRPTKRDTPLILATAGAMHPTQANILGKKDKWFDLMERLTCLWDQKSRHRTPRQCGAVWFCKRG